MKTRTRFFAYLSEASLLIVTILLVSTTCLGQKRAWTSTGSTGTVDEADLSVVDLNNFTYGLKTGATGTVHVRFNIVATEDTGKFCPATQSTIKIRFRDSDGAGTNQSVKFTIHSSTLSAGGNTVIFTFDSNTSGFPADATFRTFTATPNIDFDFVNQVYWIEAEVTRSDAGAYANLASIQIYESAGTPCP